jgi:uncharacterized protein YmfQ (DUF2313 family)
MGSVISILRLWPRGPAWNLEPGGILHRLSEALQDEREQIQARAQDLARDIDPREARELGPEWMRATGAQSGEEAAATLAAVGGQSIPAIKSLAESLGASVRVREFRVTRVGCRVGERINGIEWASTFIVEIVGGRGFSDLLLLRLRVALEKIRPAHTTFLVRDVREEVAPA